MRGWPSCFWRVRSSPPDNGSLCTGRWRPRPRLWNWRGPRSAMIPTGTMPRRRCRISRRQGRRMIAGFAGSVMPRGQTRRCRRRRSFRCRLWHPVSCRWFCRRHPGRRGGFDPPRIPADHLISPSETPFVGPPIGVAVSCFHGDFLCPTCPGGWAVAPRSPLARPSHSLSALRPPLLSSRM